MSTLFGVYVVILNVILNIESTETDEYRRTQRQLNLKNYTLFFFIYILIVITIGEGTVCCFVIGL